MMETKSSLSGLLVLVLSSTVSGLGSVLMKDYTQIQNYYTWEEAQTFCRSFNFDLAVFYTQSDVDNLYLQPYFAWVGLSKTGDKWLWPDGKVLESNFNPWPQWFQPNLLDGCAYANYNDKRFYVADCGEYYFFICYKLKDGDYKYTFINQPMTWSDAQEYCQQFYKDLAIFKDSGHLNSTVIQQNFPVWTGLYRDGETWEWSTGMSDYRQWAPHEPGNDGDCVAINSLSKEMITQSCSARYPFICFTDNLVLVKENKTWEKALEYCKALTSPTYSSYQLVSVQPGDDFSYMLNIIMEADTDEVWTGLRFLAGNWMWINGADMLFSDLPLCPLNGQNCGAFSKNDTDSLETRDCLEKKNFLCYSLW